MKTLRTFAYLMVLAFTSAEAGVVCPDFNGDGAVNIPDFLIFVDHFGTVEERYDLNADGQVNIPDFLIFVDHFGKECAGSTPVVIPDANLRAVIADSLGKASDETITATEMATLTGFEALNKDIRDLTGLEFATNLTWLDLGHETVNSMIVGGNSISDISPLSNLTNLRWLNLSSNSISDISPLSNLTNLTELYLSSNPISDISPLSNLTNLHTLFLQGNSISDISPLSNLTNLQDLQLNSNSISDISPLLNLTGLIWLGLDWNPLSTTSINTHIPVFQARGVVVFFGLTKPAAGSGGVR